MTPKEKCDELCLKMEKYSQHPIHPRNREQAKDIGKKLALVAVEEIIGELNDLNGAIDDAEHGDLLKRYNYFIEVRQEIQNL